MGVQYSVPVSGMEQLCENPSIQQAGESKLVIVSSMYVGEQHQRGESTGELSEEKDLVFKVEEPQHPPERGQEEDEHMLGQDLDAAPAKMEQESQEEMSPLGSESQNTSSLMSEGDDTLGTHRETGAGDPHADVTELRRQWEEEKSRLKDLVRNLVDSHNKVHDQVKVLSEEKEALLSQLEMKSRRVTPSPTEDVRRLISALERTYRDLLQERHERKQDRAFFLRTLCEIEVMQGKAGVISGIRPPKPRKKKAGRLRLGSFSKSAQQFFSRIFRSSPLTEKKRQNKLCLNV